MRPGGRLGPARHQGRRDHVTVSDAAGRKRRAGIHVHRMPHGSNREIPPRTAAFPIRPRSHLLDIATPSKAASSNASLGLAEQRGLVDFAGLQHRHVRTGRPGTRLHAVLSLYAAGSTVTRSEMRNGSYDSERKRKARPKVNKRTEANETDFVWHDARLIVEVDGYRYHRSPLEIRDRPPARRDAHGRRLAGHALHLDPDHHAAGMGRASPVRTRLRRAAYTQN